MAPIVFENECENPLGLETGWGEHYAFVVGVHPKYTFNNTEVRCLVEIQMPEDAEDLDQWRENGDFRDNNTSARLETTAEGARLLAALLLEAADAAEAALTKEPPQ